MQISSVYSSRRNTDEQEKIAYKQTEKAGNSVYVCVCE
jgi:hypothetical protein